MALFIILFKVILWIKSIIQYDHGMKATEPYFSVVLFIMLHNVVLTFESVNEILYYAVQGGSNF